MASSLCPIFNEESKFIGIWSLNEFFSPTLGGLSELMSLAEPTYKAFLDKNIRRIKNLHTEVGNGVIFNGGVFLMLDNEFAPNEDLSRHNSSNAYVLIDQVGIGCLKRVHKTDTRITKLPPRAKLGKWWQFWKTVSESKENSNKVNSKEDETILIYNTLKYSLNGKTFYKKITKLGFSFVDEDSFGTELQGKYGNIRFSILSSQHPTNIFSLVYGGVTGTISLVNEGQLQNIEIDTLQQIIRQPFGKKDLNEKKKICINCNSELSHGALNCPKCGSSKFMWE